MPVPEVTGSPSLEVAGLSLPGRRASNEDRAAWVAYGPDSSVRGYVVVCDGMGGHNAGEVAAAMALSSLERRLSELAGEPSGGATWERGALADRIRGWVSEVNTEIRNAAAADKQKAGMGTTLGLAMVVGEKRLVVANVGDSRVFLVHGTRVRQLSVDHTAVAEQRRYLGHDYAPPEDESANPFAHALTRSLGQELQVEPAVLDEVELEEGDLVVVTSDGVTDVLESERFLAAVEKSDSLTGVAETIYTLAYDGGSRDNISVALLASGRPLRLGLAPARPVGQEPPVEGLKAVRKIPAPIASGRAGGEPTASSEKAPGARVRKVSPGLLAGIGVGTLGIVLAIGVAFSARNRGEGPAPRPEVSGKPTSPVDPLKPVRVPTTPVVEKQTPAELPARAPEEPPPAASAAPAARPATVRSPAPIVPPVAQLIRPIADPVVPPIVPVEQKAPKPPTRAAEDPARETGEAEEESPESAVPLAQAGFTGRAQVRVVGGKVATYVFELHTRRPIQQGSWSSEQKLALKDVEVVLAGGKRKDLLSGEGKRIELRFGEIRERKITFKVKAGQTSFTDQTGLLERGDKVVFRFSSNEAFSWTGVVDADVVTER